MWTSARGKFEKTSRNVSRGKINRSTPIEHIRAHRFCKHLISLTRWAFIRKEHRHEAWKQLHFEQIRPSNLTFTPLDAKDLCQTFCSQFARTYWQEYCPRRERGNNFILVSISKKILLLTQKVPKEDVARLHFTKQKLRTKSKTLLTVLAKLIFKNAAVGNIEKVKNETNIASQSQLTIHHRNHGMGVVVALHVVLKVDVS